MMMRAMSPMIEALRQKFGPQVQAVRADREDEIYLLLRDPDIRPITEHLLGRIRSQIGYGIRRRPACNRMASSSTTMFSNRRVALSI